jgi:hypothetical protein
MSKTPLRDTDSMRPGEGKWQSDAFGTHRYRSGQLFHVRSLSLTGIFFLLVLYTLKLASTFLIPVVLALLLNFLFGSVIRGLLRFRVPAPSRRGIGSFGSPWQSRVWHLSAGATAEGLDGEVPGNGSTS